MTSWQPSLGAITGPAGTRFTVWAPDAARLEIEIRSRAGYTRRALDHAADGTFTGIFGDVNPGDRYAYLVDGRGPFPDPVSRFQPDGVHAASEVIDPGTFVWNDEGWRGVPTSALVVYELHVGTFTPEGTFAAAAAALPEIARLGVTAVELMPVADFAGSRNWGYDGVALFSPARCYGRPDDLRRLVDEAHRLGLAVLIDVVYNHLGPEGAYHGMFSPYYYSTFESPWGRAMNLDGPHSGMVRRFFLENAVHWVREYHADGLRLDATHALLDWSGRHLAAEVAAAARDAASDRIVLVIAEDHRNLASIIIPESQGGWGLDAVWADDFHHEMRRRTAGDDDGYFRDYSGTTADLAATIRKGWFFCGQYSEYRKKNRGTDPAGLPLDRFVVCLQNHDQIGNRAFGERLNHAVPLPLFRAATLLLLTVPETPLLFMGQEWAASTPFLFFTDHEPDLGSRVTQGRRLEFARFKQFANPDLQAAIPDPQALSTFEASRLRWSERNEEPHASTWRLHERLLQLRRILPAMRTLPRGEADAVAYDEDTLILRRVADDASAVVVVVRLGARGEVNLRPILLGVDLEWKPLLTTEDVEFAPDRIPVEISISGRHAALGFARAGGVVLEGARR